MITIHQLEAAMWDSTERDYKENFNMKIKMADQAAKNNKKKQQQQISNHEADTN